MKILIVTQYFWPEEFRINDIAKGFRDSGHEVEILTGIPNYPKGKKFDEFSIFDNKYSNFEGMKIYRAPIFCRGQGNFKLMLNYLSFMIMGTIRAIPLLFKRYDRVFIFQLSPITLAIPGILVSKLRKVKSIMYVQDLWPESLFTIKNINNRSIKKVINYFCRKIYNSQSLLLITSNGFKNNLIKKGIEKEKIIYFPQWAEDFYSNNLESKVIDRKFTVTFAGNIGKAQSVHTIVKAVQMIEKKNLPIEFNIIGDGSEFNNVKFLIKELNLHNINLLGRKPVMEMPKYFSESDALLVTLNNDEILKVTLPAKVQSYMAAGKPIIGAISGEGNKVIVESNSGLVGEAEDYVALSENIIKLYEMTEEERLELGENGNLYFKENFTREKLLNQLENIMS